MASACPGPQPEVDCRMLTIPAKVVYVHPDVRTIPNCTQRLERMLPNIACDDVRDLDPDTYAAIRATPRRRHGKDDFGDDAVIAFIPLDHERLGWYFHKRDGPDYFARYGGYCQSALELNLVEGCVFRCAYCGFGRRIIFSLDVERLVRGLDEPFALYPNQRLYKFSNATDLPPFEPELNAVPPMVERFAREDGRYLMLFTKSDAVDFLLGLDHRGHTIVSWSISCDTSSRLIDKRTASLDERIEAMRKCQEAGYLVRARLSPIVPVRDWRREHQVLFEKLLAAVRPDVVTLELLGWFDFEDLARLIPQERFDPAAFEAARQSAERMRGDMKGPFTEETHQEIYRFCIDQVKRLSPATPVAVCHGSAPTWATLGEAMGMRPGDYVCNCGPTSTPGNPLYARGTVTPGRPDLG